MDWDQKNGKEKELLIKALRKYADFLIASVASKEEGFTVSGEKNTLSLVVDLLRLIYELNE